MRSLLRSARRNPPLALALNGLAVRSQQWMLTAAGIGAPGPQGMIRAQGLAVMFGRCCEPGSTTRTGLARTMAALDRALARGDSAGRCSSTTCRIACRRVFPAVGADATITKATTKVTQRNFSLCF